jgi:galactofuranosylgalactofuranosylrhamnosyl-N-acetylglucosaminyl-diphospho-decaprenol beta-1,5/1,6-galactofuranosyltransferase
MDTSGEAIGSRAAVNYSAALDRHVLQRVIVNAPGYGFAALIYHVALRGLTGFMDDGLWIARDSAAGFNTFANSFYASWWARFTTLTRVEIAGQVRGRAFLRLFRVCSPHGLQDLGTYVIGSREDESFRPFHVPVMLRTIQNASRSEGRIFFDIVADTECVVKDLAWVAAEPPRQPVSVSLGICTYRKEEHLLPNLENLEPFLAEDAGRIVDRVFLVNNDGGPFAAPGIRAVLARNPRIETLTQANLGGAGGFTRSLVESLARSSSTHHIMIDDDVFFDPQVIEKVAMFLMYADRELVVGGQMMNLRQPQVLYEGGAKLARNGLLERVGVNIDCAKPDAIGFYDQYREIDYNAWWFCAIPKRAVRETGLPLNIFIRGDDFEYGTRLAEHGVPTISLPGVFVWHEPFEAKTAAWLEYYNMRNRLIFTAAHAKAGGFELVGRGFHQDYCDGVLGDGDYERLAATLLGVADFLAGPDRHFRLEADAYHAGLRSLLAAVRAEHGLLATGKGYQELIDALRERVEGFDEFAAAAQATWAAASAGEIGYQGRAEALADWWAATDAVLSALETHGSAVAELWGERTFAYASPDYWEKVFGRRLAELEPA